MHFFSGERRIGDIEYHVRNVCDERGIPLLMILIDLATDANWDYTIPSAFHSITLAKEPPVPCEGPPMRSSSSLGGPNVASPM